MTWPMTVAWIDTSATGARLGRGIVMRGRWATPDEAPRQFPKAKGSVTMPFALPNGLMNPKTIALANRVFPKTPEPTVEHAAPLVFLPHFGLRQRVESRLREPRLHAYQCVMPSNPRGL